MLAFTRKDGQQAQLLGYVLADSDDRYAIERVGFLWPRWRADAQPIMAEHFGL